MTNVDIFIDELGKLPHDNGSNLVWYFDTDYELGRVKILMRDRTRKPVKGLARLCLFEDIMAMPDPRGYAALIIEKMYYDFGEHIVDKKLLISPEEALERLKELSEDLSLGWGEFYRNNIDEEILEALDVAITCLEEKCHE